MWRVRVLAVFAVDKVCVIMPRVPNELANLYQWPIILAPSFKSLALINPVRPWGGCFFRWGSGSLTVTTGAAHCYRGRSWHTILPTAAAVLFSRDHTHPHKPHSGTQNISPQRCRAPPLCVSRGEHFVRPSHCIMGFLAACLHYRRAALPDNAFTHTASVYGLRRHTDQCSGNGWNKGGNQFLCETEL